MLYFMVVTCLVYWYRYKSTIVSIIYLYINFYNMYLSKVFYNTKRNAKLDCNGANNMNYFYNTYLLSIA